MLLGGDIFVDRKYESGIDFNDLCVFNLEYPITSSEKGFPGKLNLKCNKNYLKDTFGKYPEILCIANNHIMDYGEEGFIDTLNNLKQHGIKYYGAGYEADNCNNPLLYEKDGIVLAFLGYVCPSTHPVFVSSSKPGVCKIDLLRIKNDIKLSRRKGADKVIVSYHWGEEEVKIPKADDVKIARKTVEFGADLIVGHHTHCIQSHEVYKDTLILYGLGNLIFPELLRVPANYDSKFSPQKIIKKQHFEFNKKSFLVNYNFSNDEYSFIPTKLNEEKLELANFKVENNTLTGWTEFKYRFFFKFSRLRRAFLEQKGDIRNYSISKIFNAFKILLKSE